MVKHYIEVEFARMRKDEFSVKNLKFGALFYTSASSSFLHVKNMIVLLNRFPKV